MPLVVARWKGIGGWLTGSSRSATAAHLQSFHPSVWSVARATRFPEAIRYGVQRLAELLDPHAHFAASASFTLDPLTAVREFLELAQAYHLSNGANPSLGVMADATDRTRHVLVTERNLVSAYGQRVHDASQALDDAVDFGAAAAQKISRKKWFDPKVGHAARGPLRALDAVLDDPATGYRTLLQSRIQHACAHSPASDVEWRQFDDDLRFSASLALADGRDGTALALSVATEVARMTDDAAAVAAFIGALTAPSEPHLVAVRVLGVRNALSAAAYGCRRATSGDKWDGTARATCDAALTAYITEAPNSVVLLAEVDAHDVGHARTLGIELVEKLVDQYRARHRAYSLHIDVPTLVMRPRGSFLHSSPGTKVLREAKARLPAPEPLLEQSLRYAALARSERAPIIKVLHSWIALKTLARGSSIGLRPYPFVMEHVSSLLALHGVRNGLAATWQVASRAGRRGVDRARWDEVEVWLGVTGTRRQLPDLNRWLDVMRFDVAASGQVAPAALATTASLAEAAAVLEEMVVTFPPFVQRAVRAWQWRLAIGSRLSNWCDEMEHRAKGALGRMYVVRNSSVHTALTQKRASGQMAHAASNITDTVFEVLPRWLRSGGQPSQAFERVQRRSRHVRKQWNNSRAPLVNADRLTTPGGDGLSR